MALLRSMSVMAAGMLVAPALLNLDINGYLTGTEFLTVLASAISALFVALFGIFTGNVFGTGAA